MITALILAAGRSTRMGQPKMLLPWGETTVLGQVIETIRRSGIEDILVITGGAREEVEAIAARHGAKPIFNAEFNKGEMLSSIQAGLRALAPSASKNITNNHTIPGGFGGGREGVLVVLGDQPQVQERSVRAVVSRFEETKSNLVLPSYQMRRGHPWLVASPLWGEILAMREDESPRDFLNRHSSEIEYVIVDNPSILADLDTPEDYLKSHP